MARRTNVVELPMVSPGTRRTLVVHRWGQAGAHPKAYIHAALHANEWPGLLVAHHLALLLDEAEEAGKLKGEVVIVPYANPIGLNQYVNDHLVGRHQLSDEGDAGFSNFNRDWPDFAEALCERVAGHLTQDPEANVAIVRSALLDCVANLPVATERDAHRKALLGLSIDADLVLDFHCDLEALLYVYSDDRDPDSLIALSRDLQAEMCLFSTHSKGCFDYANAAPWELLRAKLGLGEALPLACFAATLELRGQRDVSDEMNRPDAENIFRFLMRKEVVAGDPGLLPPPRGEPEPIYGVDLIRAPAAGLLAWKKRLGDQVAAGEVLADLVDVAALDPAAARTPIRAEAPGRLHSICLNRIVRPGALIGRLSGRQTRTHLSRTKRQAVP